MDPNEVIAILEAGGQLITVLVKDAAAFKTWLSQHSDAADTAQLEANDAAYAAAVAEERQKAAGG